MKNLLALAIWFGCLSAVGHAADYRVGVGRIIITPETPMPMAGFAARTHESEGVIHDLWAKSLAIEDGRGGRVLIITADLIALRRNIVDQVAARLKKSHGIERSQLLVNASHTHCGPEVGAAPVMLAADSKPQDRVGQYTRQLVDKLVAVAEAAFADLAPAEMSVAHGTAGFAVNRRQSTPHGVVIGVNRDGPVDHDVPVLKIASPGGKLRAVLFGYACHNSTLLSNCYRLNGDYAGFAQAEIEKSMPGVTAMFIELCGGDQNASPRGAIDLAKTHGSTLATEVRHVLSGEMQRVNPPIRTAREVVKLKFAPQSRETFVQEAQNGDRFHKRRAERMLKAIDAGRPTQQIDCPVQAVRLGRQWTLVAIGGEVVVEYALRLKRENPGENLVVAGYSNDVMCYVPTARMLREGGYEPVLSTVYFGLPGPLHESVEETVMAGCRRVLRETAVDRDR
ncbi:MAG: neutral/alkaline non-lysosomal ceramidase N-terminal domain-containing protein [Planctomycetaceae bacterium]|nr:neutral/alkaline non-lysosomal ceramidase N-terminal domain-containing protein [Planctomycetaceae bacterium]